MGIDAKTDAAPPPGAAADWTIPQTWSAYTPEQHALLKQTPETDFAPIYAETAGQDEYAPLDILPTDRVITRGTQAWDQNRSAA